MAENDADARCWNGMNLTNRRRTSFAQHGQHLETTADRLNVM